MKAWLRRLWAELRRDHVGEHARARELYARRFEYDRDVFQIDPKARDAFDWVQTPPETPPKGNA